MEVYTVVIISLSVGLSLSSCLLGWDILSSVNTLSDVMAKRGHGADPRYILSEPWPIGVNQRIVDLGDLGKVVQYKQGKEPTEN